MIHHSKRAPITQPLVALGMSVFDPSRGDVRATTLIDAGTGASLTRGSAVKAVDALGRAFFARGFRKGDVVGLMARNGIDAVLGYYGVLGAGAAVTTLNPLMKEDEVRAQLEDARAAAVIVDPEFEAIARSLAATLGLREVFVTGGSGSESSISRLIAGAPGGELPFVDPDDVAVIPYSSGTTGLPKGVMLTHRNLTANLAQMEAAIRFGPSDVLACVLPFFHIYGQVAVTHAGMRAGAAVVMVPRYDLESYLRVLSERRVTVAHVVPPILLALARDPRVKGFDLSALRLVFCAAAPLSAELQAEASAQLGCPVTQAYGMTEASPATHFGENEAGRIKPGSIGSLVSSTECRIVDVDTGALLGVGLAGEIHIRGPQVMKGYLGNPAATAATITEDGWLLTGDVGYVDADGDFYIVDRIKELIKVKGYQVAPAELEALLLAHPAVEDAAVIGIPDAEKGEVPKAFVVLKIPADLAEIQAAINSRLAPYKRLGSIAAIPSIPKSPSGKILRRLLRGPATSSSCPESEIR